MKTNLYLALCLLLVGVVTPVRAESPPTFSSNDRTFLTKQLFLIAVRFQVSSTTATNMGTGFLVRDDRGKDQTNASQNVYLVTNRHMVEGFNNGTITFIPGDRANKPLLGCSLRANVSNWSLHWTFHPSNEVDVAVMPMETIHEFYTKDSPSNFPTGAPLCIANLPWRLTGSLTPDLAGLVGGSEEVIFVGYPSDFYDTAHFLPVARHGYTASPLALDFMAQQTFAVDAAVFPGSSGSPVFIYNRTEYQTTNGWIAGSRILLAGIIAKTYYVNQQGRFIITEIPSTWSGSFTSQQPLNMGIAFKAETILETIDHHLRTHPSRPEVTSPIRIITDPSLN